MMQVPAETPETTPEVTVATAVLLLLHEPPANEPVIVDVAPEQKIESPVMYPYPAEPQRQTPVLPLTQTESSVSVPDAI